MIESLQISHLAQAIIVSISCENFKDHQNETETQNSLEELSQLLKTLGISTVHSQIQKRKKLEAATLIGKGALEELAKIAEEEKCQLLVFDCELTASQVRNIKEICKMEVIDRYYVILEIFAKHARTREAKIQIEMSRLEYMLPRLTAMWSHFSRQKGGIGIRGGEGEQQLELDRRLVKTRVETLKKQLNTIVISREEQKKRRKDQVVTAALFGYTNAGKSSLMNRLCKVKVLEEDKLFATLDSTYRTLNPDSHPPMVLIDTVGLISNLPTSLISGFKSTLESAMEADLLIVVCDVSDPNLDKQLKVTQETIDQLGLSEKEKVIIFNKKDKLSNPHLPRILKRSYPNSFLISSLVEEDIVQLREFIINYFLSKQVYHDLFVPYEDGNIHSIVLAKTNVVKTYNHQSGIFYRIRIPSSLFHTLGIKNFVLAPHDKNYINFRKFLKEA